MRAIFFGIIFFFCSGVETFHSPQRNAAKEYFVLAMAAMQVLLILLLSLLALPGQRCKHCVAAKEFFFVLVLAMAAIQALLSYYPNYLLH